MNIAVTKEAKYTINDYLKWDDSENWELIDAIPVAIFGGELKLDLKYIFE